MQALGRMPTEHAQRMMRTLKHDPPAEAAAGKVSA